MPIYVYRTEYPTADGDRTMERMVSYPPPERIVEAGARWVREVASTVAIIGNAPRESQGETILKGYQREEERLGSRFRTRFPVEQIKREWSGDRPTAYETAHDTA